jgi:hypothetical protein
METSIFKRSYHPLLIVLFQIGILDKQILKQIPYSTRHYWNHTSQEDQFGYEYVLPFLETQLDLKAVYTSKLVFRFCRFVCRMHDGYSRMANELSQARQKVKNTKQILADTIAHLSLSVPVAVAAQLMNSSYQQYYRMRNTVVCAVAKTKRCFRSIPQQLSFREINAIDHAVKDPDNFNLPKVSVYYDLILVNKISCSLATFYAHCKDAVLNQIKKKISRQPLIANYRFQYLHVDITELICTHRKVLVAFVKENYSKAILGFKIIPNKSSAHIRDLFREVFSAFDIARLPQQISIVSDGGSENKGELLLWIAQQVVPEVKKLTAGIDVKSNSHSESVHHTLKKQFLQYKPVADAYKTLIDFVYYYNHRCFPTKLYGYTRWQVLEGAEPDKNRFKEQLRIARIKRVEENRKFQHCQPIGGCLKECLTK